jgi:hypothetical protein
MLVSEDGESATKSAPPYHVQQVAESMCILRLHLLCILALQHQVHMLIHVRCINCLSSYSTCRMESMTFPLLFNI